MNWWHYLILANLYLALFYGFYLLFLRKETYFILNRVYLVSAAILSFFIPMMQSEWVKNLFITQKVQRTIYYIDPGFIYQVSPQADNGFTMAQFFTAVYWAVAMLLLARLFYRFFKLKKYMRANESGSAFSFFGKISVDENLPQKDVIYQHEMIHAEHLHSADVLLFEALTILNWFNPIIYCYRKSIKHNHEFIADQNAISFGVDKADYALLLLSQTMSVQPNHLVNSFFNQSLLKQRIMMLHKNPSKRSALLKYGLSAPLFGLMLIFTSATVSEQKTIRKISDKISSDATVTEVASSFKDEINASAKITSPEKCRIKTVSILNGKVVDASGKSLAGVSVSYTKKHIGFITGKEGSFTIPNYEEGDMLTFNLESKGYVILNKSFKNIGYVLLTKSFKNIPEKHSFVVLLSLKSAFIPRPVIDNIKFPKPISFAAVEKLPSFPGGEEAFSMFLAKHIKYPKEAKDKNIQGRVIISFIVEKDGSLTNIKVLRDISGGAGLEAVRVLSQSPKWNPGIQNGGKVRVAYTMPVNFTLAGDDLNKGKVKFMNEDSVIKRARALRLGGDGTMTMSGFGGKDSARQRPPADVIRIETKIMDIDPVYMIEGKEVDKDILTTTKPSDIESITVLKGKSATNRYGDKGKNGVVEITMKKVKKP